MLLCYVMLLCYMLCHYATPFVSTYNQTQKCHIHVYKQVSALHSVRLTLCHLNISKIILLIKVNFKKG